MVRDRMSVTLEREFS